MDKHYNHHKKTFRSFQLKCMGFIAVGIGPAAWFFVHIVHGLPFPRSISETATIANRTDSLLPFLLGSLALFTLSYAVIYAHDFEDRLYTIFMFAGFTVVALQMCASPYIISDRVGVLGVSPEMSATLHNFGAFIGFGSMIMWVLLCFKKSDRPKESRTPRKIYRNRLYTVLGIGMIASLLVFVFDWMGFYSGDFPTVFVAECLMLTFGGAACLIKGGFVLEDDRLPA